MKKTISKTLLFFIFLTNLSSTKLVAQNDTPTCYAPLTGSGKTAIPIFNNVLCVGTGSPCNIVTNVGNIVDVDTTNFSQISSVATLPAGSGVTVKDAINTYPAGYIAGYVLDLGSSTFLNASVLSSFTILTYNDDVLKETSTSASLASATAIGTSPGKVYLTFKTAVAFDEVRFVFNSAFSAFSTFRIYYAFAFNPNCGFSEDNGRCGDQIGGSSSVVTFNGGSLANVLSSIDNPGNITDGNKNTFATITIPVAVGALGANPYVGVLHQQQIYAANTTTGFVVSRPSIATLDVLDNLRIQTYLFGVLQDDRPTSDNSVAVSALTGVFTGVDDRISLSIVTTKQYNEVRLVLTRTASLNVGTLRVYYAFEQPNTCTTCTENLVPGATYPFTPNIPTINANRTGELGTLCVPIGNPAPVLSNTQNVVNTDINDFASYTFGTGVGVGCGFRLSIQLNGTVAAGAVTGFVISRPGSILGVGVLENTVIRTYLGGVLQNTSTAANLAGLTVLSTVNGDKDTLGFRAANSFDEIEIRITTGTININLGSNREIRVYNAFVIRDSDNDGTPNCQDQCATGNDAIDTDSDGLPDCLAVILPVTLTSFDARIANNKQVLLTWQTLNEVNTKQFTIERSAKPAATNSPDWQVVKTLIAAGSVTGNRTYQLYDEQPFAGNNYYRLRTTDRDGKQSLSEIRQVNFKANSILLSAIYPNPVVRGKSVTIAVAETATYRLLDNTGRLVDAGKIPVGNSQLKVPATAGTYLLEIAGSVVTTNKEHHRIVVQ